MDFQFMAHGLNVIHLHRMMYSHDGRTRKKIDHINAISHLESGKAPDADGTPAEL